MNNQTRKEEGSVFQTLSDRFGKLAESCDSETGKQLVSGLMGKLSKRQP